MSRFCDIRDGDRAKLDKRGEWPEITLYKHTLTLEYAFGGKAVVLSDGYGHISSACYGQG